MQTSSSRVHQKLWMLCLSLVTLFIANGASAAPVMTFKQIDTFWDYNRRDMAVCPSGVVIELESSVPKRLIFQGNANISKGDFGDGRFLQVDMSYAAQIFCDASNRLWAFNTDRTLWRDVSGSWDRKTTRTAPQWQRVSTLEGAKQVAVGAGAIWAFNDDKTLWRSNDGVSFQKIGELWDAAFIAASADALFAVNGEYGARSVWMYQGGGWSKVADAWAAGYPYGGGAGKTLVMGNIDATLWYGTLSEVQPPRQENHWYTVTCQCYQNRPGTNDAYVSAEDRFNWCLDDNGGNRTQAGVPAAGQCDQRCKQYGHLSGNATNLAGPNGGC